MKNTIKIGDTVVRRVKKRDSWWNNSCDIHKLPVDGHYVVVGFSDSGSLKLQGFHSDYSFTAHYFDLVKLTPEQEYEEAKKLIQQGFPIDYSFTDHCFDLVELTPEQEYKEAKKLIGKTVKYKDGPTKFRVEKVILRRDDDGWGLSQVCRDHLKEHGYVVAVSGDIFTKPFPVHAHQSLMPLLGCLHCSSAPQSTPWS